MNRQDICNYKQEICDYIRKKYGMDPEYKWRRYSEYAIFRHADNNKQFALLTTVPRKKIGLGSTGTEDVIDLKIDDMFFRDMLIQQDGILPSCQTNRMRWISVVLDGTVPEEQLRDLIDMSFMATASARKKEKVRPPKEWIIPANPKYFDIVHAFDNAEIINWKQGAGIKTGDTVYMYVGAPVSAVLYKCKVTETGIPYKRKNPHISIKALMRIQLQRRYAPDQYTFSVLKEKYGIHAVRGPRGIPASLSADLGQ